MPKYCRYCRAEITNLDYRCYYTETGTEYGTCDLDGGNSETTDHDSNDYSTDEYTYHCPECDEEINFSEDIVDSLDDCNSEERLQEHVIINPVRRNNDISPEERVANYFPSVECPECHKMNFRGEDRSIICEFCNNEILI